MKFSPVALAVFVVFSLALLAALAAGPTASHLAEAVVTVLILIGIVGGFASRRNEE